VTRRTPQLHGRRDRSEIVDKIKQYVEQAKRDPPRVTGTAAASAIGSAFWWVATVMATAGGLAVIALDIAAPRSGGILLIAAPHLVGALVSIMSRQISPRPFRNNSLSR